MEQVLGAGFVFMRVPVIHFGAGKLAMLPKLASRYGDSVLLVTGSASFARSVHCSSLMRGLADAGIRLAVEAVSGEPSPAFVDDVVARHRAKLPACVIAIGGGSAIDAGKAISAMLAQEGSVRDFLEGMETRTHDGRKVPFIAVPTSSGTGAEATKNAVLSEVGPGGFKRSLRHDNFVPDIALVDPALTLSCPAPVTSACGLDALTQLLEAYVSTQASPMTDALALSGLQAVASGFVRAVEQLLELRRTQRNRNRQANRGPQRESPSDPFGQGVAALGRDAPCGGGFGIIRRGAKMRLFDTAVIIHRHAIMRAQPCVRCGGVDLRFHGGEAF